MGGRMLTAVVILLAVGIGLVWLVTLGLCFSARRSDEQWDRSNLPITPVELHSVPRQGAHKRSVPRQGAHDRRRTERRGSQERRARPISRDDLTG